MKKVGLELTFESHKFKNVTNADWKRITNSTYSIERFTADFRLQKFSQMMIRSNEPIVKHEGQKTNKKLAKYHQNAGRQKWKVCVGFETPPVVSEAQ